MPWSYTDTNENTGEKHWTGYCMALVQQLSQELDFDYEIIVPKNGTFGKKLSNGVWDGTIGDLIRGVSILTFCYLKVFILIFVFRILI